MRTALFVSNGVGEDLIAASLAAGLRTAGVAVTAYPLVGLGVYPPEIPLLNPRQDLPSGGFSLRAGHRNLAADLAAGMIRLWRQQRKTLARQRGTHHIVVAVGDTYCLWMASRAAARTAFVATADSSRISPFGTMAKWALRHYASRIFARDQDTADVLSAMGLFATAGGIVAMDDLRPSGEAFGLLPQAPVVTLLPGSRRDAVENAVLVAQAAEAVAAEVVEARCLMTVAPTVPAASLVTRLGALARAVVIAQDEIHIGGARLRLTGAFADALLRASVVIGLAGTANEQAAGLGRPVVAFPGPGAQFSPQFLATQHRLLGDALVPTRDWQEAAAMVVRLLRDPFERQRRGAVGRERMGPPGGAQRITAALLEMLNRA
ncbi:MAG: lipid-A-disaccharide synthase-related protein [Armatimonadota bacterium]